VGCALNGPAKYFRVLGRCCLETFLRSTCLEWLYQTLCSYARYLNVSTLQMIKIDVTPTTSSSTISTTTEDLFIRRTFQDPNGYPRILGNIDDLRPLRGRHAYKASLRSALPVVWTSLGPLPRWVPGPTTLWAPGTTRLVLHGT
jgi:hypothetical protein